VSNGRAEILRFDAVEAAHSDGTPALRGVSLSLHSRERAAVLGANGAGKSSFFLVIGGFLPYRGSARLFGQEIASADMPQLRRRAGFVFERAEDQLFLETLGDDVAFGPRNAGLAESEVARRVAASLDAVGLRGFESRNTTRLSHGEARLAAIATALAMEPEILVVDEPTANLDARARRRVVGALAQFPGTLLLLTHDLDAAARLADRAFVLAEGRLVFDGSASDVETDPRAAAALGLLDTDRATEIRRESW
jgi:cobalt/nickel transport system ATP-binding protein